MAARNAADTVNIPIPPFAERSTAMDKSNRLSAKSAKWSLFEKTGRIRDYLEYHALDESGLPGADTKGIHP
jgi:hypothetical protein